MIFVSCSEMPRAAAQNAMATLTQQLAKEPAGVLAKAAREQGDASRGAMIFYRPDLLCTRCHAPGEEGNHLGPDPAKSGKETTDVYLVESILQPSKVIKKGFETVRITTKAGKTLTGLFAEERADALVLRDAAQDGKLITIREERHRRAQRQGAVADAGGACERTVRPARVSRSVPLPHGNCREGAGTCPATSPGRIAVRAAAACRPTNETSTTPASSVLLMVRVSSAAKRSTFACVPTATARRIKLGSMPTSLRFAEGKFKNGADPFHMYQTLTHGFGMMTPQTWMVPEQKYDVIHYHPRGLPEAAQPGAIRQDRRRLPCRAAEGSQPRPEAIEHRAVGEHELRPKPDGDHSKSATRATSPTRASRCGWTTGRAACRAAGTGCCSITTRCGSRRRGAAKDSSTGTASTSTAGIKFIRAS